MAKSIKSILKKIFWIFSLILLLIIGSGLLLAYIYEAEVKQYVVEKINEQTNVKIKVEKIDLSFLRRFPMAALQFHKVEIEEVINSGGSPGTLLKSDNIFLKFSIVDIIQNKFVLKNVEISGAQLNLVVFQDGSDNFHIFDVSSSDSSDFFLELDKVLLNKSKLHYTNYASKQTLDLDVHHIAFSGIFSPSKFSVNLIGSTQIRKYTSESYTLLNNKNLDFDIDLAIEPTSQKYMINKGNITYNKIPLTISGDIEKPKQGVKLNLKLHSQSLSIAQVKSSLPPIYQQKFNDYTIRGLMQIDGIVKGTVVSRSVPLIMVDVKIKDAEIENTSMKVKFQDINFNASYSNGKKHSLSSSAIRIKELHFATNFGVFQGKLSINNFVKSKLQLQINSQLNLDKLIKFTGKLYGIKKLSGNADLELKIGGNMNGLIGNKKVDFSGLAFQANVILKGSSFMHSVSDIYYQNMVGKLRINKYAIVVEPTDVSINGNRHNLRAEIQNYLAWNKDPEHQKLRIRSYADVSKLSYSDIQKIIGSSEEGDGIFPKDIDLKITFKADTFLWKKMIAHKAGGIFKMQNQIISFQNIHFNAFGGYISGNCSINGSQAEKRPIIAKGNLANVDIQQLFHDFHNFDQAIITDKHIKGKLTSDFVFNAYFNRQWSLPTSSIVLESNIRISQGELNNIKELNALSNYTRIKDFSHIEFSELNNFIQIKNRKLMIPEMTIKSNKFDLDVAGTHDFDNKYDYHMSVLMSDVLFNKAKANNKNEFGEVQNDGYGHTKLFFHVYGQGDDLHVKYDRKGVAKKLKSDLHEEGESLKSALNKEFGWFKKSQEANTSDSLKTTKQQKKKEEQENLKKQEEGKFIFEWDDEEEEDANDPPEMP